MARFLYTLHKHKHRRELWKIEHWGAGIGGAHLTGTCVNAADGYIVGLNLYDNQIYAYGKGPSTTTVDVKDNVATIGGSVLITGTVTDQSPGAKAKVANGQFSVVPAVRCQPRSRNGIHL